MEEINFTYGGIPITIRIGLRKCEVELPSAENPSLKLRILAISPEINLNKGSLAPKITEQLIDPDGKIITRAATPSNTYLQKPEDYNYFYHFVVGGNQKLGEVISKQMINGILENSPLGINVYSHTGEFIQPLTYVATYEEGAITITPLEFNADLPLEYSFDGETTWQDSPTQASPAVGNYTIGMRYKAPVELRVGRHFKAVQETTITVDA